MKLLLCILIVLVFRVGAETNTEEVPEFVPVYPLEAKPWPEFAHVEEKDIRNLTLAAALIEYPIEQSEVSSLMDLPDSVQRSIGSSGDPRGHSFYWPLIQYADGRQYYLTTILGNPNNRGIPAEVIAIDVVYRKPGVGEWVLNPHGVLLRKVGFFRAKMKELGMRPGEFSTEENIRKFWSDAMDEDRRLEIQKNSNQSPQTTSPSRRL